MLRHLCFLTIVLIISVEWLMYKSRCIHKVKAFTLIELVAVILLMSVTLIGATSFMSWGTLAYVDGADRQRMLEETRFIVERITRELRNALPNSVRISADGLCVEFIPILASGSYYDLGEALSPTVIKGVTDNDYGFATNHDVVIQPQSTALLYDVGNDVRENVTSYVLTTSSTIDQVDITLTNTVTYAASAAFNVSKANRYYMVNNQISYCANLASDNVSRIEYTTLFATQPTQSQLNALDGADVITNEVMVERVTNSSLDLVFSFADDDLTTVQMLMLFSRESGAEPMEIYHQVRVKNAS